MTKTAKKSKKPSKILDKSKLISKLISDEELLLTKAIWCPIPGPQQKACESEADETLYGGAAGGGKTDLLIGLALTRHQDSLILRREYPRLRAVIERSRNVLGQSGARYNGSEHLWRDVPGGRTLEFGAMEYEKNRLDYQGRPHDLLCFDELTEFTETQYLYLWTWVRSTNPDQRCRIVCASNPPTSVEGEWVSRRWAPWIDPTHSNKAEYGELRWYVRLDDEEREVDGPSPIEHNGEMIEPRSRTFIPAFLADNPYYADTSYASMLAQLPEPLYSIFAKGRWDLAREDDPWQVIPTDWVNQAMDRWVDECPGNMTGFGADVSRGGKDATVYSRIHGLWFAPLIKRPGKEIDNGDIIAHDCIKYTDEGVLIGLDCTGAWGTSPYDTLRRLGKPTEAVNFAAGAKDIKGNPCTDKTGTLIMRNERAKLYWFFREALDPKGGLAIALPPDPELLGDLTSLHWKLTTSGVLIEAKEEVKKRLQRSTDCGDAVVIAWDMNKRTGSYAAAVKTGTGAGQAPRATAGVARGDVW